MVKKLLKHEFTYYIRTLALFLPIVLVVGVMARIFRLFDDSNAVIRITIFSSSAMLFVSCAALLILATVVSIVRFYKNMYSAEGYLTLTLPVNNAQHIFVKLLVAMVCQAVCLLVVLAAVVIALWGEDLFKEIRSFVSAVKEASKLFGAANMIGFAVEMVVLAILSAASTILLYYACITVGQTAKKNRILKAIGAYFVYYVATQILATMVVIVITVLGMSDALDGIVMWISDHAAATIHIYQCSAIVLYAVLATGFWLVTQYIMTEKLNLE